MTHYLVVGLGLTGQSVLEFLSQNPEHKISGYDTREDFDLQALRARFPQATCSVETFKPDILKGIDVCVVSPGVPLDHPLLQAARQARLKLMGDIELFYQHAKAPIIGITGTNAKSTVTTLVADMINAAGKKALMGGNIGLPALALLDQTLPDFYVLELSSFQLELTETLSCFSAAVLNVSPDHLDRHITMEDYQAAKERLYQHCRHPVYSRAMKYQNHQSEGFSFGQDRPATEHDFGLREEAGEYYLAQGDQCLMKVSALGPGLMGVHNVVNALSALALVAPLGLPLTPQLQVLQQFKGLPHRCVLVRTLNGVRWFNDSKGTNIGATEAAIYGLSKQTSGCMILILGGIGKGQDFRVLRPAIQAHVSHTLIFGQDQKRIAEALEGLSYECVNSLDEALHQASAFAEAGDVVLFSPACASFDMFKNYEHRGDVFTEKVNAL